MAGGDVIVDTGPLVGFLNKADQHHGWAKDQFHRIHQPLWTCEAVISEAVFLLHDDGLSVDPLFEMIRRDALLIEFSMGEHEADLRRVIRKYRDLPMSFADACLVRMTEVSPKSRVFTVDRHFSVYRRSGRGVISLLSPY